MAEHNGLNKNVILNHGRNNCVELARQYDVSQPFSAELNKH